jgi:hypothetical protein
MRIKSWILICENKTDKKSSLCELSLERKRKIFERDFSLHSRERSLPKGRKKST